MNTVINTVIEMSCEDVRANAGAYALGALSADERAAFERHVAACQPCAEYCASFAPVSAGLLAAAPLRRPPPQIRAALLQKIQPAPARPSLWARLAQGWAAPRRGVAFAGMALVLAVALIALAGPIGQFAAALQNRQMAQQLAADPAAAQLPMFGRPAAPQASGTLRFRPDAKTGVLEARALPALPANQAYQLWLVNPDGTRDSGAVFQVRNSDEWVAVSGSKPLGQYIRFGITVEPAGGSPGPTGPGALNSQPA